MLVRSWKLLIALVLAVLVLAPLSAQDDDSPKKKPQPGRVLLISIDAFRPEAYREDRFDMPTLRALAARGVQAKKCTGVFPTLTYPSHTTIATGCRTGRHGVYSNAVFEPKEDGGKRWYFESSYIKVPTLWDVAKKAGLTTSTVRWPVTNGATTIDWHIAEIFAQRGHGSTDALIRENSTPGLVEAVWKKPGRGEASLDESITAASVAIIQQHKPDLMMIHLLEADGAQHANGREAPEVYAAFKHLDDHLATIFKALDTAGVASTTNIIVTGDHGMMDVHTSVKPNALLRELGFLKLAEDGTLADWTALANTGGGAAGIYLKDPNDKAAGEHVLAALKHAAATTYRGIFTVLDHEACESEGAFPEALCALEGAPGFTMGASAKGEPLGPAGLKGNHGYLPSRDEVATGFVAAGPGIARGRSIPFFRQVDIAPLAAHLLGVDMGKVDGTLIPGVLHHEHVRHEDH